MSDEQTIEQIAEELYAGGPYGEFFCFADEGARAVSDAHSMTVYRGIVADVLDAAERLQQRVSLTMRVLVCPKCGATSVSGVGNGRSSDEEPIGHFWSAAGRCHLNPHDREVEPIEYVPKDPA